MTDPATTAATAAPGWDGLLALALPGTVRADMPVPALPGQPAPAPADAAGRARQLLQAARALDVVARAGTQPAQWPQQPPAPAPPEYWPAVGPDSAQQLRQLLRTGRDFQLMDCLRSLDESGQRVPHALLPWLLDWLRTGGNQPAADSYSASPVLGMRGQWLARLLPPLPGCLPLDLRSPEVRWQQTDTDTRQRTLAALLRTDPARASVVVLRGWPQAVTAQQQHEFFCWLPGRWHQIGHLPPSLQPWLESLLTAPEALTRRHAGERLAQMPGNELLPRLWALAQPWLTVEPATADQPARVVCRLPPPSAWTPAWRLAGLDAPDPADPAAMPARWLSRALRLLPPRRWFDGWQVSAARAVELVLAGEGGPDLLKQWMAAQREHRDPDFALALLPFEQGHLGQDTPTQLTWLRPDDLATWIMAWLPAATTRPEEEYRWLSRLAKVDRWPLAVLRQLVPVLVTYLRAHGTRATYAGLYHLDLSFHTRVSDPAALPLLLELASVGKVLKDVSLRKELESLAARVTFVLSFAASLAEPGEPAN